MTIPTLRADGKVVVVTGATKGLGRAMALGFAEAGADVVVSSRRIEGCEEVAELIRGLGRRALPVACHVGDWEQCQLLIDATVAEFGRIDVLVNNAGIANAAPITEFTPDMWRKIIDINLTGTFLGIHAVSPVMARAGRGSIINISSVEGMRGSAGLHGYVASKFGVRGLTKSVALDLGPSGVRVNSVHPGFIKTPMTEKISSDDLHIPLGRAAEPEEVSQLVLFLASDESSYSTGSEFIVDGGLIAGVPHK